MKKLLILITLLTGINGVLSAKEIAMSCDYTNVNGSTNNQKLIINTGNMMASAENPLKDNSSEAAVLYSDADTYWFTIGSKIGDFIDGRMKFRIDRNDLSFEMDSYIGGNTFEGQCEIVEHSTKI